MSDPPLDKQQVFWNRWNAEWRFGGIDGFMVRQREVALEWATRKQLEGAAILDVGCGTGWLGNSLTSFGRVLGVDLSPDSIEKGRSKHPSVELRSGDFLTMDLGRTFDFIVSADSLAHFYDQQSFFQRIATLLRPGGTFLLMTQNAAVWAKRAGRAPQGEGHIQRFPTRSAIQQGLSASFDIEHESTIAPGGDEGWLWWVENRGVRGVMGRIVGPKRWEGLLERAGLGRELVIVARRR
jgi:SAM-dependent methyltransferase